MTDLGLIKHKRARQVCHLQKDGTLFAIFISSLQKIKTMAEIINSFSRINKELRYGVIYVVTSFERVCDDESNYIRRLPTKLMEWLGRLTGFQVEVVEMPEARGTTLVA